VLREPLRCVPPNAAAYDARASGIFAQQLSAVFNRRQQFKRLSASGRTSEGPDDAIDPNDAFAEAGNDDVPF
jgi:hypothetical protein